MAAKAKRERLYADTGDGRGLRLVKTDDPSD
jgi:hypothetical protein